MTMRSRFILGVAPATKLQTAFCRTGCGMETIEWLSTRANLLLVESLRIGASKLVPVDDVIDFSGPEMRAIPDWKLALDDEQVSNRVREKVKFDQSKFGLVCPNFMDAIPPGSKVAMISPLFWFDTSTYRGKCSAKVVGTQLLRFYLEHQYLVPDNWKPFTVVFLGTLYEHLSDKYLCCLYFNGNIWDWAPVHMDDLVTEKTRFVVYE